MERIMTDHKAEWAFYWWMRGYTMAEIAEALFVSNTLVWRAIERKRIEKKMWCRPPLKYDENWRIEK